MKVDTYRFCNALGAELKYYFERTTDPKTRERLRLSMLAAMSDTTENTLRTLFRGGADSCKGMVRPRVDLCLVLRVCEALGLDIIETTTAAKQRMERRK